MKISELLPKGTKITVKAGYGYKWRDYELFARFQNDTQAEVVTIGNDGTIYAITDNNMKFSTSYNSRDIVIR